MSRFLTLSLTVCLFAGPGSAAVAAGPPAAKPATRERSWHTGLAEAQAEAAKTGKLIFVDLYAEWCGWCRVLDRNVFSDPVFDPLAEKLVLVRLDVEDGAEGSRTQSRYQASALPTTLILEPSGVLVGKVTGVSDPPEYVGSIERKIELHQKVIRLYDRVIASQGKEAEPRQLKELAEAFHQRGDGPRAAALYRLLVSRGGVSKEVALLSFRLADAHRLEGDYRAAAESAARARKLASEGGDVAMIEAIDLLDIQIATEQGDCSRRRQTLESFLRLHPESAYHRRVESTLVGLKTGRDGTGCSGA